MCVAEDGNVHIYDMFGTYIRQFTMGAEVQRATVIEAEIFYRCGNDNVCSVYLALFFESEEFLEHFSFSLV